MANLLLKLTSKIIKKIFSFLGYNFSLKIEKKIKNHQLNLNIGAGDYVIENFKSLDFYSKHYYPDKNKFLKERIEYNLRGDDLPFIDNSVNNIYASHVIEHIEDIYVIKFINESFRVLKPSGVLRIVCPDAKFLYNVSSFSNNYWRWREKGSFSNLKRYHTNFKDVEQYDYLIRELSTPNCRFYNNKIFNKLPNNSELKKFNYDELKKKLLNGLTFREEFPGDHINIHDFDSLYKKGVNAGFSQILESKKNGSISIAMQGIEFDKKEPRMSLYVEMIK